MSGIFKALVARAVLLACVMSASAQAQQRPEALGGPRRDGQAPAILVDQVPSPVYRLPGARQKADSDALIRKQTAAIMELSEKIDRLDKRVSDLEARIKK